MAAIELRSVSKKYSIKDGNVDALTNVSLSIDEGEIFSIIGMSGAGKSTLVRCINLLETPSDGVVNIFGRSMGELDKHQLRGERRRIGMIFQQFNLLMQRNVLDNVAFPLELMKVPRDKAREKARELIKLVDLADKEKAFPAQLSGGQKQRVAIARALASEPRILLCDEATSALDPSTTKNILSLIKKVHDMLNITVVMITHEMSVARSISDRVAVLDGGRVVECGRAEDVLAKPKTLAAKRLLLMCEPTAFEEAII